MKNLLVHPGSAIPDTSNNWPKNVLTINQTNQDIGYKTSDAMWPNYINTSGMQQSLNFPNSGILFATNMDDCVDNRPGKAVTPDNIQLISLQIIGGKNLYSTDWSTGQGNYLCRHNYSFTRPGGDNIYYYSIERNQELGYNWLAGPFSTTPGRESVSHENIQLFLESDDEWENPPDPPKVFVSSYRHALSVTTSAINYFDIANGLRYRKAWSEFRS